MFALPLMVNKDVYMFLYISVRRSELRWWQ